MSERGETVVDTAELAATLVEESELYASLLGLTTREEQAIVAGDVEGLTELVEEKERLLELLAVLETERATALTAIGLAIERDPPTITLSEVAAHAAPQAGATLLEAGMVLRAQAVALRDANERNTRLLQGSRSLIDNWIRYLRAIVAASLTYDAGGTHREPLESRVLDRSA